MSSDTNAAKQTESSNCNTSKPPQSEASQCLHGTYQKAFCNRLHAHELVLFVHQGALSLGAGSRRKTAGQHKQTGPPTAPNPCQPKTDTEQMTTECKLMCVQGTILNTDHASAERKTAQAATTDRAKFVPDHSRTSTHGLGCAWLNRGDRQRQGIGGVLDRNGAGSAAPGRRLRPAGPDRLALVLLAPPARPSDLLITGRGTAFGKSTILRGLRTWPCAGGPDQRLSSKRKQDA